MILSFNVFAENAISRTPGFTPKCNLPVSLTYIEVENGVSVVREKSIQQVQKEQCKEARICMESAEEEDMKDLKNLEAAACSNILKSVTTKVPGNIIDKNFDGKREAKAKQEQAPNQPSKNTDLPR